MTATTDGYQANNGSGAAGHKPGWLDATVPADTPTILLPIVGTGHPWQADAGEQTAQLRYPVAPPTPGGENTVDIGLMAQYLSRYQQAQAAAFAQQTGSAGLIEETTDAPGTGRREVIWDKVMAVLLLVFGLGVSGVFAAKLGWRSGPVKVLAGDAVLLLIALIVAWQSSTFAPNRVRQVIARLCMGLGFCGMLAGIIFGLSVMFLR